MASKKNKTTNKQTQQCFRFLFLCSIPLFTLCNWFTTYRLLLLHFLLFTIVILECWIHSLCEVLALLTRSFWKGTDANHRRLLWSYFRLLSHLFILWKPLSSPGKRSATSCYHYINELCILFMIRQNLLRNRKESLLHRQKSCFVLWFPRKVIWWHGKWIQHINRIKANIIIIIMMMTLCFFLLIRKMRTFLGLKTNPFFNNIGFKHSFILFMTLNCGYT